MWHAIMYRKDGTIPYYAPSEFSTVVSGRLEHGAAIPIPAEIKLAVPLGGKTPIYPNQIPIGVYTALFELLIPDSMCIIRFSSCGC